MRQPLEARLTFLSLETSYTTASTGRCFMLICLGEGLVQMKTIRQQIEIECSQEVVFDLSQNYSKRLEWDPYLTEAYLLDGADRADIRVEAYCKNRSGAAMVTKYISFDRPQVAAVKMVKGPFLLRRFSGAWNFKRLSDCRSQLTFNYHFELRGGLFGRMLLPIATYLFSIDMNKRLEAIKHYLESQNANLH